MIMDHTLQDCIAEVKAYGRHGIRKYILDIVM